MQAALTLDPSHEKNLEFFKNSEFESIKGLLGNTRMMIEGNSQIKNVFPAEVAGSLWRKTRTAWNSVLCLGKNVRSWRCNQKVEWSSVNFEDLSYLQRIARIGWRTDWLLAADPPRSHRTGYSPRNSGGSAKKARHTWKLQWSKNLHVNVQRRWSRKETQWRFLCCNIKEDQKVCLKF